ncbi:pancreas/duodenum homeobox protein 1 [Desulfovibrio litoralis]|uniref:Pancreas/duodenum homeobox protein 1 n=1 Tax=Desulfovibrio litoralis DSM 11393 TaxID=1121455 RepID=A0A1M7SQX2_9BACT|nr:pancreas/duodenum homeobox protein 1 [Desulfovibrio litoralis]SHN60816.1 hypothetical protein SAMN02745728_01161 [Desulfovibrio litoralis DSM 11393]
MSNYHTVFNKELLLSVFPPERTDEFFEALFGGAEEGAYDIELSFVQGSEDQLEFSLDLLQRQGKCLVCSLTYGLPQVFSRHPIININKMVKELLLAVNKDSSTAKWKLNNTQEISKQKHSIPLIVTF